MTTSELIQKATSEASKLLAVALVTFSNNYHVEMDTEYMELAIFYTIKDELDYHVLKIRSNSRSDKQHFGVGLLLERLDARLLSIKLEKENAQKQHSIK